MANEITSQIHYDFQIPPVAKEPSDCVVGPTEEERVENQSSWRSTLDSSQCIYHSPNSRKRQRVTKVDKSTFSNAIGKFLSSGCCVIPNVLPDTFVKASLEKSKKDLEFLETQLVNLRQKAILDQNTHILAQVGRGDFRELVDRDGGRRDVRFQLDRFPFTAEGLIYNSIVFPLVRALLGGGHICLLYAGVMWAKPNEKEKDTQKWHADGGHLFSHTDLPPHCINVFYPLVDLSYENGCTEFVPGSHRLGNFNCDKDSSSKSTQFGLCCKAGAAVLFDYRLKHRGGSNTSKEARPVLYLAYSKPFFRDTGNTRSERSLIRDYMGQNIHSPPWVSRILKGTAVPMGKGFENTDTEASDETTSKPNQDGDQSKKGSGERWVLFRMNIEIPDCDEAKTITVYHGDLANEVATQFCRENGLDESFIPVLQGAIQQQRDTIAT